MAHRWHVSGQWLPTVARMEVSMRARAKDFFLASRFHAAYQPPPPLPAERQYSTASSREPSIDQIMRGGPSCE